jgi:anti-sigma regulatory factor (Ser/Thr protein kinase)
LAAEKNYNLFGLMLAFDELVPNAAKHSLNHDPKKNVRLSWDIGEKAAHVEVSSECGVLFDPLRFLCRDGSQIAQELNGNNPHLGTQMLLWYADRMEYEWATIGGKLTLAASKSPQAKEETFGSDRASVRSEWTVKDSGSERRFKDYDSLRAGVDVNGAQKPLRFRAKATYSPEKN